MLSYPQRPLRVIESQVDWLTATIKPGLPMEFVRPIQRHWFEYRETEGYQRRQWTWKGYVGETIDGLSYGERPDSAIVRLSGEMASRKTRQVLTFVNNVSRLDVQVTVVDDYAATNWHKDIERVAHDDPRVKAGMTGLTLIDHWPMGRSVYIGSRSSDRYFRVYDKHAESEGVYPVGSWRWEIEYKAGRALRVAEYLMRHQCTPEVIRFIVGKGFDDYGVKLPVDVLDRKWTDAGIRHETDDERRLQWLRTGVRPMLSRLAEAYDRETLLDALGLGDLDELPDLTRVGIDPDTGEVAKSDGGRYIPIGWSDVEV